MTAPAVVTVGGSAHINANTDASGDRANGNITGTVQIDKNSDCIVGGYTAGIDVDDTGLEDKIKNAVSGDIIIIDQDYKYKANPIEINKEITINLDSYTIRYAGVETETCLFSVVQGGSLTIQGNGTIMRYGLVGVVLGPETPGISVSILSLGHHLTLFCFFHYLASVP